MRKQRQISDQSARGERFIRLDAVYRLDEFKRRTGLGDWAMRHARTHGLRVIRMGGKSFVKGADFVAYLDRVDVLESAGVQVENTELESTVAPFRNAPKMIPITHPTSEIAKPRDGLATIKEVSEHLRISRSTIYGLMDAGKLPYLRIGRARRIAWSEVKVLAARSTVGGQREPE